MDDLRFDKTNFNPTGLLLLSLTTQLSERQGVGVMQGKHWGMNRTVKLYVKH